jgi:hypothetical protein
MKSNDLSQARKAKESPVLLKGFTGFHSGESGWKNKQEKEMVP